MWNTCCGRDPYHIAKFNIYIYIYLYDIYVYVFCNADTLIH